MKGYVKMHTPNDGAMAGRQYIEDMLDQLHERDSQIAELRTKVNALETVVKLIRDYSETILSCLHQVRTGYIILTMNDKAIEGAARVIRSIQENRL